MDPNLESRVSSRMEMSEGEDEEVAIVASKKDKRNVYGDDRNDHHLAYWFVFIYT